MSSAELPSLHRTRVKICGLTREQDVDAAVGAGADALGFVFYPPSPRYVTPERAAALARRLPALVTPVLLFVNPEPAEVQAIAAQIPGAVLQFHGDESESLCLAASAGRPYLKAARIPRPTPLTDDDADASTPNPGHPAARFDLVKFTSSYPSAKSILLDALVDGFGGAGHAFDWSLLPAQVEAHLILSGGLNASNVGDGIRALRGRGRSLAVDVSSGVEVSKGVKSAEKIFAFMAAVRAADKTL